MNLNETIRNAWKLCDKIDELQSFLWQRYHREFLELMEEENFKNRVFPVSMRRLNFFPAVGSLSIRCRAN